MTLQRQVTLLAGGARHPDPAAVAVCSDILLPFIAGLVLAYFLDPVATGWSGWPAPSGRNTRHPAVRHSAVVVLVIILLVPILGGPDRQACQRPAGS